MNPHPSKTESEAAEVERRRRKAARPATGKKVCAEFRFSHMGSHGWHFTRIEARVMKWEHFGILAVLAAVVYLVASWLAKH
jgi:hypothetical protein